MGYLEAVIAICQHTATEDQWSEFLRQTDKVIFSVYRRRIRISTDENDLCVGTSSNAISFHIDFNTFSESCWELMTKKGLLKRICSQTFSEDKYLFRYVITAFENLLHDRIYNITPGLRTRIKQLDRLMSKCAKREEIGKQIFWVRIEPPPDQDSIVDQLVESVSLRLQAARLKLPEARYPDSENANRGMRINESEMEDFLKSLLNAMGGRFRRNSLIQLIAKCYGLFPPFRELTVSSSDDEPNDSDVGYTCWPSDIWVSMELQKSAHDVIDQWTEIWKCVFVLKYVYGYKQTMIAEKLGKSNASISNLMKKIEESLKKIQTEKQWAPEEFNMFITIFETELLEGPGPCPS
ncbi:MAG: hypothetical protein AB1547_05910 [Thermodesulfobacteriota bacterium]